MPARHSSAHEHDDVRELLRSLPSTYVRVEAQEPIYASGDQDDSMYLIESGQVKLFMSSAAGKDCLVAIYATGDVFGESCFYGPGKRQENATSMMPTVARRINRRDVVAEAERRGNSEMLFRHLALRIAERQAAVFDLVTMDAQRRLAKVLLDLATKLGEKDGEWLHVEQRMSHEELSQMVGTTRPRITSFFQKFRKAGLIETREPKSIRVHAAKMRVYVDRE